MPRFISKPTLSIPDESEQWILESSCVYKSDLPINSPTLVIVPEGFKTDLASIPVIFRSFLFRKNGKHRLAAIVHDKLCRDKGFNRILADNIFLEAMKVCKVGKIRRNLMFAAVRLNTARINLLRKLKD